MDITKIGTPLTLRAPYLVPDVEQYSVQQVVFIMLSTSCPSAQRCVWHVTGLLIGQFKAVLRANLFVDLPPFVVLVTCTVITLVN